MRKLALGLALGALAAWGAGQDKNDSAQVLFGAAVHEEEAEGDLHQAIRLYETALQKAGADRKLAAAALVRLGQCHERLGGAEARKAYERVLREFGDQRDSAETARRRLAAMGKRAAVSGPGLRLAGTQGYAVAVSPDGRFLLQAGTEGGLDVRNLQTGEIRRIAKAPFHSPAVSHNGRQVAFMRRAGSNDELRLVSVDGSDERLLWKSDDGWSAGIPQWFPDGKRILVLAWDKNWRRRLLSVTVAGGEATGIWDGKAIYSTQLSPDGKSVVFMRRHRREEPISDQIWLLRLGSMSETLLFDGQSFVNTPIWTPDGTGVVFLSDRRLPGAAVDLWLLRISEGKALGFPALVKTDLGQMAKGKGFSNISAAGPITRDGVYYFHRTANQEAREPEADPGMRQLLSVGFDPDTGKVVGAPSFVARKGGVSRAASFSRDGRWLAYILQQRDLVIQSVESGEERTVAIAPPLDEINWAKLFPDGRAALVTSARNIYRVDVTSGVRTSLRRAGESSELRGWVCGISPDGRILYFRRTDKQAIGLFARNLETGQERKLYSPRGTHILAALSHDGKQLAVTYSGGNDGVVDIMPAAGGPPREVCRLEGTPRLDLAWEPDGRHLICLAFPGGPANSQAYMRVPVNGGGPQPIGLSAHPDGIFPRKFGQLVFHPNGRQIVYRAMDETPEAREGLKSGIWALENFLPGFKPSK